ncbi:hypothetical protein [Pseudovibrio sp. POLY-S9]|uniref:hypothetical protein n=1 Tax=Pseudovibrio sp. POLY-S9 TaxID=1576596 RepID=UPI00070EDD93|nr:hypothetical protein [Pseudovibrio sp. POLY-S9]
MIYTNKLQDALSSINEANGILKLIAVAAEHATNEEWLTLREPLLFQIQSLAQTKLTSAANDIDEATLDLNTVSLPSSTEAA